MKRSMLITVGVVIIVVIAGAILLMGKHPATQPPASSPSPAASTSTDSSKQAAVVIMYTSTGFSPAETTVKSGDSVTFENKTSEEIQVRSEEHTSELQSHSDL